MIIYLQILLSYIYKSIVIIRNKLFDNKLIKTIKLPIPVISIGNISVGGSGKTPFSIYLAQLLLNKNLKPAIIAKGYKRKNKKNNIVSDGRQIFCDVESAGDEAYLIAQKLSIPVVIHYKKYQAAKIAYNSFEIDCLIVDDGFQHRKLHRDLNILLLNDDIFNDSKLLPAGKLREEINSINRADIIAVPDNFKNFKNIITHNQLITIKLKRFINKIYNLFTLNTISIIELSKNKTIFISAIASPKQFELTLNDLGLQSFKHFIFPDHYHYTSQDLSKILKFCQMNQVKSILTTEKDAVKLKNFNELFANNDINLYVCQMEITITEGLEIFQRKIDEVFSKFKNKPA